MLKTHKRYITIFFTSLVLSSGCTTSSNDVFELSQSGKTSSEIYDEHISGKVQSERQSKFRMAEYDNNTNATWEGDYRRVPNPEMYMYVYPTVHPTHNIVIPAMEIKFSKYKEVRYVLPADVR